MNLQFLATCFGLLEPSSGWTLEGIYIHIYCNAVKDEILFIIKIRIYKYINKIFKIYKIWYKQCRSAYKDFMYLYVFMFY